MGMSTYSCCTPNTDEAENIQSLSEILKLVGEPSRLKILCLLRQEEHCVCDILVHFDMSQSLVSHHLSDLKAAGLVSDRKEGRQVYYKLTDLGQNITDTIFSM